jgi:RimJ/RimL family protein N-acetyltransferase
MVENEIKVESFFKTERCICREMTAQDVYERCEWGEYDSKLLAYYTFSIKTDHEKKALYNRWKSMKRLWYAIELIDDGTLIAILSLRDIKKLVKSSRLGLVVKPEYINQGYGTEIVDGFMRYYFKNMGYRTLCLDAAQYNKRALWVYKKCGFKICGKFDRKYAGDEGIVFTDEYKDNADCFLVKRDGLYAIFTDMKLSRKEWEKTHE